MLIGIMSDSHDHMGMISRAVARFSSAGVELILHAGDFISPLMFNYMHDVRVPFHGVFGNNDGELLFLQQRYAAIGTLHQRFYKATWDSLRFVMTHEDHVVDALAHSGDFDVVVYGHTHRVDVRRTGATDIINPGELCGYCTGRPTAALFDTTSRSTSIIDLT